MKLSKLANKVKQSATLALNTKAAKMKAEGKKVIHLGGGEPKSLIPQSAEAEAVAMLKSRVVRYTPVAGTPELRNAVVDYTQKHYGKKVNRENVIISSGAKQTIMVAMQAILDSGDEVIFPAPYWVSYPDMVTIAGGVPVPVVPSNNRFQVTLDEIRAKVTHKTRIILINSPNNPSGQIYSKEFLESLVRFCEDNEILLISDELYRELTFSGSKVYSLFDFLQKDFNESSLLVINGVSKQYAMTGFRIGWGIGPSELISAMIKIQGHETSCPSSLSQKAAVGAIRSGAADITELRKSLEVKRNLLVKGLDEIDGVKFNVPQSTFYSFVDFSRYEKDSEKLAEYLIEKAEVVTVPGKEFGMDGFLRISFCGPEDELVEGLKRIGKAVKEYK